MSKERYVFFPVSREPSEGGVDSNLDELCNNDHDLISAMTNEDDCEVHVFKYMGIGNARTRHSWTLKTPPRKGKKKS